MKKKAGIWHLGALLGFVILFSLAVLTILKVLAYDPDKERANQLRGHEVTDVFALSDVFDFDWDCVYIEHGAYQTAESPARKDEVNMNGYEVDMIGETSGCLIFTQNEYCVGVFRFNGHSDFLFLPLNVKIHRGEDDFVYNGKDRDAFIFRSVNHS